MAAPVLQFKRGLLTNLPALKAGEPGFTTDSYDFYVGLDNNLTNNKFVGSHRYWTKETNSVGSGVNLVEATGNGGDFITLKSPDSLSGITTYTFPATPIDGNVLTTDANGDLSWTLALNQLNVASIVGGIGTFYNDVGFTTTTDNVLGDPDTGAVQIDGGLGVNKNVTVGAGLSVVQDFYVGGVSTFVGSVTFQGGTINIGDSDTDDINVAGEFISNLIPNTDDTYDIGDNLTPKRWRNAAFSGVGTFATGSVVDAVQIGISGSSEIDTSSGDLILDSASGQTTIDDNLYVSGISTVNGDFFANSDITLGTDNTNTLTINADIVGGGVGGEISGTISTATRAQTVDTTTASDGTYYPGLFESSTGVAGTSVYVDSGISYVSNTDTLSITGALDVNGGADIFGLIELDDVNVSSAATIAGALDVNGGADISGGETTLSSATVSDLTDNRVVISGASGSLEDDANLTYDGTDLSTNSLIVTDLTDNRVLLAGTSGAVEDSANLTFDGSILTVVGLADLDDVNVSGAATVTGALDVNGGADIFGLIELDDVNVSSAATVTGALDVNGGADISGGETTLSSATVSDLTAGRVVIAGTSGSLEDSGDLTFSAGGLIVGAGGINVTGVSTFSTDVTVGGNLTVGGNTIKASDGTTALTLVDATGAVAAANDLTVAGNLYVNGNTTQVNTTELSVYDRTITLGIQTGVTPSTTTWDLGVLMNYGDSGIAKTAGVIWEYGNQRFVFSSNSDNPSSSGTTTPDITVSSYAPIEIGALWVNDCAGQSQVISCTGTERFLENITIDSGTF